MAKPKKYQSNNDKFEPSSIPVTSPWRDYAKFNKYDETFPITVYQLGLQGKSKAQIASVLNCSSNTFNRWITEIDDMKEAWEVAQTKSESYWDDKIETVLIAEDNESGLPATNTKLLEKMLSSRFKKYSETPGQSEDTNSKNSGEVEGAMAKLMESFDKLKISASSGQKELKISVEDTPMKVINPRENDDE